MCWVVKEAGQAFSLSNDIGGQQVQAQRVARSCQAAERCVLFQHSGRNNLRFGVEHDQFPVDG